MIEPTAPATERGRRRRADLLDAAEAHLRATRWRSARITEVARAAGCPTATFYQHFPSLEAAAWAVIARIRAEKRELGDHLAELRDLLEVEEQLPA